MANSKNNNKFKLEFKLLQLNCNKAKRNSNGRVFSILKQTIKLTTNWYKTFYTNSQEIKKLSIDQIKFYEKFNEKQNMKVVILAGGFGTRLSEYTNIIPKPMIKINGKPLIYYIMKIYAKHGFKDFYIALGYKGKIIKRFFKNNKFNWKINLIETGLKTMTGGRLKRLSKYLKDETFLMTYGDGVSDINIKKLIKFHKKNKKEVTHDGRKTTS